MSEGGHIEARPAVLTSLVAAVGGPDVYWDDWSASFYVLGLWVEAVIDLGDTRVQVSAFLDDVSDSDEAQSWMLAQAEASSAHLEVRGPDPDDGLRYLVATFDRPVADHDWSTDPFLTQAQELAAAWAARQDLPGGSARLRVFGDPVAIAPSCAWLMVGDNASVPSPQEHEQWRLESRIGRFTPVWTGAKQTLVGDLLLVYFTAPTKSVRFVTRAASNAFFSDAIEVNSETGVAQFQWWVKHTPLIEIEPIPFAQVQAASNDFLLLRGRSGHYLGPKVIEALPFTAVDPAQQGELNRVLRVPVGLADLPTPAEMTFEQWRRVAPGALPREEHVSEYLVEPLLRMALAGTELRTGKEHKVGRKSVDYVVQDGARPVCAIEVKLSSIGSKDLDQLAGYTGPLSCPGVLMDSRRLQLVGTGQTLPHTIFERRHMTDADLATVAAHLRGLP